MDSILVTIKKLLGISEDYTQFDIDIIVHINSALSLLCQLGVGPANGFSISGSESTWTDFVHDYSKIEFIKSYVYYKVRLMFDPPTNSSMVEQMNKMIAELEWRIMVASDPICSGTV